MKGLGWIGLNVFFCGGCVALLRKEIIIYRRNVNSLKMTVVNLLAGKGGRERTTEFNLLSLDECIL